MELIGRTLGQYRIMEQIGAGGMATVYKAYQPGLDRFVAIKILPPQHAQAPGYRERFFREAVSVARLSHPNILPVYDVGIEDDISYFVMKYVPGQTLRNVMGEPMTLSRVCGLIDQMASALDHAHAQGIIHRDVKPANILLEGEWVLFTDFGIAKIIEETRALTLSGELMGTPAYMSPEQASGKAVDHRTDIYSLGVVLFEMITGRVPFKGETPYGVIFKHVHDALPLPRSYRPDVSEEVERVILKALAKAPEDRFESAGSMALALHAAFDATEDGKTLRAPPISGQPEEVGITSPSEPSPFQAGAEAGTTSETLKPSMQTAGVSPPRLSLYVVPLIVLLCLAVGWAVWVTLKGGASFERSVETKQGVGDQTRSAQIRDDTPPKETSTSSEKAIPVTLSTIQSNAGWTINLEFADKDRIKDVLYRFDDSPEFKNLGHDLTVNPQTGFRRPNTHFDISALTAGEHRIEVKYRDFGNLEHGPYVLSFDTASETAKWVRHVLEVAAPESWVSINQNFVYFSSLLSFKYGLKEIRYSIDEPSVSKRLPFVPAPGDSRVGISDKDLVYFQLPKNAQAVYVQLVYLDGTESEVKRFPVKQ